MRYRMALGQGSGYGAQPAVEGFGRGLGALFQLPLLEAQAADEAQTTELKRGLMGAQADQARAHAALYGQQLEDARTKAQRGTMPEMITTAAMMNRVAPEQIPEVSDYFQTGQLRQRYDMPADMAGPAMPRPAYADPNGVGGQIMRTLGLLRGGMTAGGKIDDITNAQGQLQKQDAIGAVMVDPTRAPSVGQAYAAADGKPLVDNVGTSGRSFNRFTGQGGVIDAGMAALFDQGERAQIGLRNEQAGQARAGAAENYAQASAANALARQRNDEIGRAARSGDIQTVTAPDGSVYLVNKLTGESRVAVGPDGRPVIGGKGGAPGGGGKPMTEAQSKANLFGGRMMESDKILSELEAKGVLNSGIVKGAVQGTVGMLPLVGDKLSDAAGSVMNTLPAIAGGPNSDQQRVEQARRDFVNAVLRRESGAVILPAEFANAEKQYFPQPGDSKAVIEQKRRNRQIATTLMLREVPEAQRYQLGTGYGKPAVAPPRGGGATGDFGPPTGRNVKVDY